MSSKQTDDSWEKKPMPEDWLPIRSVGGKPKSTKPTAEEVDAKLQEVMNESIGNENSTGADNTIQSTPPNETVDSLQTELTNEVRPTVPKRISGKQRKESLEEYRQAFLTVPKLEDRKPVFVSCEVRDRLDEIVRKLGGRRMSVSGFIENLARHHLELYRDDVELWKKL